MSLSSSKPGCERLLNYASITTAVLILVLASSAAGSEPAKIDTRHLSLPSVKQHVIGKSGLGKRRERWYINAIEFAMVEAIGDDPADVDVLGVKCADHDSEGARIDIRLSGARCRKLYLQILGQYVDDPERILESLLSSTRKHGRDAVIPFGSIQSELSSDGDFLFMRKQVNREIRRQ